MSKRIITAVVLLSLFVPIFLLEMFYPAFFVVIILLTLLGAYEMTTILGEDKLTKYMQVLVIVLSLLLMLDTALFMGEGLILEKYTGLPSTNLFMIYLFPLVLLTLMVFNNKYNVKHVGHSLLTIIYVGIGFASILTLRQMGVRFIIYLFTITIVTDMFAFFIGVKFGKHKMTSISPKKSYEGAIAGTIMATIFGSLFALFYDKVPATFNPDGHMTLLSHFSRLGELNRGVQAFIIVPITFASSILGQIGDLVASKLKREYGAKDFGDIFPGHGGVIDRFDSAMFASMFLIAVFILIRTFFPLL